LGRPAITPPIGHVYSTAFEGLDKRSIPDAEGPIGKPAKYELAINLKTDLRRRLSGERALTNFGLSDATSVTSLCASSSRMLA